MEEVLFFISAFGAIGGALAVVLVRNPFYSVLSLVVHLFALATLFLLLNAEFIAPFPGAGNDRTLRLFGFMDVGNVFGEDEKFRAGDLRASAGIGLSWLSPIGPLRIAMAQPVRKKPGDRIQRLQFQIGTSF